jgi:putative endonuclease
MAVQSMVYILANPYRTIYIGVTGNIERRLWEHRFGEDGGWTKKYGLERLIYFECFPDMASAIRRETQLKKWNRAKKLRLIESINPKWLDLSADWTKDQLPIPRRD